MSRLFTDDDLSTTLNTDKLHLTNVWENWGYVWHLSVPNVRAQLDEVCDDGGTPIRGWDAVARKVLDLFAADGTFRGLFTGADGGYSEADAKAIAEKIPDNIQAFMAKVTAEWAKQGFNGTDKTFQAYEAKPKDPFEMPYTGYGLAANITWGDRTVPVYMDNVYGVGYSAAEGCKNLVKAVVDAKKGNENFRLWFDCVKAIGIYKRSLIYWDGNQINIYTSEYGEPDAIAGSLAEAHKEIDDDPEAYKIVVPQKISNKIELQVEGYARVTVEETTDEDMAKDGWSSWEVIADGAAYDVTFNRQKQYYDAYDAAGVRYKFQDKRGSILYEMEAKLFGQHPPAEDAVPVAAISPETAALIAKHKEAERAAMNRLNRLPVTRYGGAKDQAKADQLARDMAFHEKEWRRLEKEAGTVPDKAVAAANVAAPTAKPTKPRKEVISRLGNARTLSNGIPDTVKEFAERRGCLQEVRNVANYLKKLVGRGVINGVAIGKNYSTLLLDITHDDGAVSIDTDTGACRLCGESFSDYKTFKEIFNRNYVIKEPNKKLNEDAVPSPVGMAVGVGIGIAAVVATLIRQYKKEKERAAKNGQPLDRKKALISALQHAINDVQNAHS